MLPGYQARPFLDERLFRNYPASNNSASEPAGRNQLPIVRVIQFHQRDWREFTVSKFDPLDTRYNVTAIVQARPAVDDPNLCIDYAK